MSCWSHYFYSWNNKAVVHHLLPISSLLLWFFAPTFCLVVAASVPALLDALLFPFLVTALRESGVGVEDVIVAGGRAGTL